MWWSIRYRKPSVASDLGCEAVTPQVAAISWWKLLRYRQAWAFVLGKFLTDPVWWFYLFWLPGYFNSRFKLDLSHIGLPLIVVYVISTIGSVFASGGKWDKNEAFFGFQSFTVPPSIYRYDLITGNSTLFRERQVQLAVRFEF